MIRHAKIEIEPMYRAQQNWRDYIHNLPLQQSESKSHQSFTSTQACPSASLNAITNSSPGVKTGWWRRPPPVVSAATTVAAARMLMNESLKRFMMMERVCQMMMLDFALAVETRNR